MAANPARPSLHSDRPLHSAYDCVVVGSGFTAQMLARSLAEAELTVLHVLPRPIRPPNGWLHPRFVSDAQGELRRRPLAGLDWLNASGQVVASWPADRSESAAAAGEPTMLSPRLERVELSAADDWSSSGPGQIDLRALAGAYSVRCQIGFVVGAATQPRTVAVGGIYRGVFRSGGLDQDATQHTAQVFATQRPGEAFWLVPLSGGLVSLGWLGAGRRTGRQEVLASESLGSLFEEALVACPTLTQQLYAAHLVGNLYSAGDAPRSAEPARGAGWHSFTEFEDWVDPVFASGLWLARQSIPPLVAEALRALGKPACAPPTQLPLNWEARSLKSPRRSVLSL